MADEKRKVYFMKIHVRRWYYHDDVTDLAVIKKEIFDVYADKYKIAETMGNFEGFSNSMKDGTEFFTVTKLHYDSGILCGAVGRCSQRMKGFVQERNIRTFDTNEILPSNPQNMFEHYSYFAISPNSLRIAYFTDAKITSNIPRVILEILRSNSGEGIYEIELSQLLDQDIKGKLIKMKGNVKVTGWIDGKEGIISEGMPSIRSLEKSLGSKFSARIKISTRIWKTLTDEDADEIIRLGSLNDGYSSMCFEDEQGDSENEIVDVIRKQVTLSKDIVLSADEQKNPEAIWGKLCAALV